MKTIQQICKCGKVYYARLADIRRGWAKSCSKSCAAKKRTMRESNGNYTIAKASKKYSRKCGVYDNDPSWDSHKSI